MNGLTCKQIVNYTMPYAFWLLSDLIYNDALLYEFQTKKKESQIFIYFWFDIPMSPRRIFGTIILLPFSYVHNF